MKKILFCTVAIISIGLASCGSSCVECKGCNDSSENGKICKGDDLGGGLIAKDSLWTEVKQSAADKNGKDGCSCSGF